MSCSLLARIVRLALPALLQASTALAHPVTLEDVTSRVEELIAQADGAYRAGDYAGAARFYRTITEDVDLALIPDRATTVLYNLACSASRAGHPDEALAALGRAVELGWSDAGATRQDPDLQALRDRPEMDELLARMEAAGAVESRLWGDSVLDTPYRDDLPEDEKIAGLSRLWMEAKYNFAYFDQVPELDWDAEYLAALPRVRRTTSTLEYYRELAKLMAKLEDGHTNVMVPREILSRVWSRPPITTELVEGRVLVTGVFHDGLDGVEVGDEVVAVDGTPVREYAAARIAPFVCASTPQDRTNRTYGGELLRGARDEPVALELEDAAGRRREVRLPRDLSFDAPPPVEVRPLADGVVYVAIRTFDEKVPADSLVAAAWKDIASARALVIDIRDNGGGSSGWWVMKYLTTEYALTDWATRQYRAAFRAWGRPPGWYRRSNGTQAGLAEPFEGKVALLVSPRTFSAAEDFAAVFRYSGRGTIVGEPSGGSTGQPLLFRLPGGGRARVCTKRDTYPDGTEFVGVGVLPDVEVTRTVAGVRAGRDEVLERAAALLR